jgi:hypothetical protein
MSIRGSKESAPDSGQKRMRLICVLICGAAVTSGACASATVNTETPKQDAAAGGAGGGSGGNSSGGASGQSGKNDAANKDASYGSCNPFTNEGCSDDKKCTALQTSSSTLNLGCGSKGDKAENDDCSQIVESGAQTGDDCGDGLACFGVPTPTCHRLCSDNKKCPSSDICGGPAPGIPTVRVCQPVTKCMPLEQTGCDSGEGCYFTDSSDYTGVLCAKAGTNKPGETCSLSNDCQPGSTCLIVGSSGVCSSFCSAKDDGEPKCTGADTGGDLCNPLAGGESAEADLGSCRQQP